MRPGLGGSFPARDWRRGARSSVGEWMRPGLGGRLLRRLRVLGGSGRPRLPAAVLVASLPACVGGDVPRVAFLGDSLTAGWRIGEDEAWPAVLARRLATSGRPIRAVNAGVGGDTVARAAARLADVLKLRPDVLVVALGVNDGLLGVPFEETERGLRGILTAARESGARVLLVGVSLPPGAEGTNTPERVRFLADLYPRLAADYRLPLVPDLLAGVGGEPDLLFRDRLHPTAAGHLRLADNVRPHLERVLAEVEAARRSGHRPATP